MPHKEDVAAAVDELEPGGGGDASVNTVVGDRDGRLVGHSTDGDGFVASLAARRRRSRRPALVVVGAGGAARSVVDALGRGRCGRHRRGQPHRRARAEAAAAPAGGGGPASATVGTTSAAADVDRQRHTSGSPAVTAPTSCRSTSSVLRPGQVVADLVYHPLETALLRAARLAGCTAVDGLGMLVHQAVRQQVSCGPACRPDLAVMRAAAEAELARRP